MPPGSLYHGIEDTQPIGRARLLNLYGHCYPGFDLDRWYRVWDVGQDAGEVFLEAIFDGRGRRTPP